MEPAPDSTEVPLGRKHAAEMTTDIQVIEVAVTTAR